jgi:hypothetical protein
LTEDMLEPFADDPPPPPPPQSEPHMRVQNHRDGSRTRVLVRTEGRRFEQNGVPVVVHAVTVWFTPDEWALIERTALAGLGLTRLDE